MTAPVFDEAFPLAELTLTDNIRSAAEQTLDRDGLRVSVAEQGILLPVLAVRADGGVVKVRDGARRVLSALDHNPQATGPVLILGTEDDTAAAKAQRILVQWWAGTTGEPLSTGDQARAVQEMLDLGVKPTAVAKQLGLKSSQVKAAKAAAGSQVALTAADDRGLDLVQAGALAALEADAPDLAAQVAARLAAGMRGGFDHLMADARGELAGRAARAEAAAKLEAAGVRVIDDDSEAAGQADYLYNLRASEDATAALGEEDHQACPGHAAVLRESFTGYDKGVPKYAWQPEWVCTDPGGNGHVSPYRRGAAAAAEPGTEEEQAAAAEAAQAAKTRERRRVLANNKAWRAATTVRHAWLKQFAQRKRLPDGALRWMLAALAVDGGWVLGRGEQASAYPPAQDWLGVPDTHHHDNGKLIETAATDQRALVIILVLILAGYEAHANADWRTWRSPDHTCRAYLARLADWGYDLSPVEAAVAENRAGQFDLAAHPGTGVPEEEGK